MKKGRIRKALDCHLRAVELYPEYDEATHNVADLYFDLGRWDECVRWKQRHFEMNAMPASHCLVHYPMHLWQLGLDAEADAWLERLRLHRTHAAGLDKIRARIAMGRGDLESAREFVERVQDGRCAGAEHWQTAAEIEARAGADEAALRLFERSIALDPTDCNSRLGLARCQLRRGDVERGSAELDGVVATALAAIEAGDERTCRPRALAAAAALRGECDEAFAWLERAFDAGWRQHRIDEGDPLFESLGCDPRFEVYLARMRDSVTAMRERVKANGWVAAPERLSVPESP